MDCVVVYLPAERLSRQGGQTKLSATGSNIRPATCNSRGASRV